MNLPAQISGARYPLLPIVIGLQSAFSNGKCIAEERFVMRISTLRKIFCPVFNVVNGVTGQRAYLRYKLKPH